jgi:tetratricopeptide (TPR) repeat protein
VETFLKQCDEAIANGRPLEWDVLSKAANLQYYRAYLPDSEDCPNQKEVALEWITRALVVYPEHVDLTVKRADTLALLERFPETAAVLEALYQRVDCPFYVEQWLGYYLLYIPGREDEAIRCCRSYLARFPESNEALRNLASGYAQKACLEARQSGGKLDTASSAYTEAIKQLREVIRTNPEYLPTIREKWSAQDGSFSCFGTDPEFQSIVEASQKQPPDSSETGKPVRPGPMPQSPDEIEGIPTLDSMRKGIERGIREAHREEK